MDQETHLRKVTLSLTNTLLLSLVLVPGALAGSTTGDLTDRVELPQLLENEMQRELEEKLATSIQSVKETGSELEQARKEIEQLQAKLDELAARNAALSSRLEDYAEGEIEVISYQDRVVGDTFLRYWMRSNRIGVLRALLFSNGQMVDQHRSEQGLDHVFSFKGLRPEREYKLRVVAIDNRGADSPVFVDSSHFSDLSATTHAAIVPPSVSLASPEACEMKTNSIKLKYSLSSRAVVQVTCQKQLAPTVQLVPCKMPVYGKLEKDLIGRVSGDFKKRGSGEIVISGLDPDTPYVFHAKAVMENGLESDVIPNETIYRTSPMPPSLAFDGPINVEMRPDKFVVSWGSTVEPERAAFVMELATGEKVESNNAVYVKSEKKLTAELPVGALVSALAALKPEAATGVPTLSAKMVGKDGELVVREFRISVRVPDPKKVGKNSKLSEIKREALAGLGDALEKTKKKKLSWQDVVELGLPILMSFF